MGFGLEVINDDGIIQIDGSTPNLVLLAKGSANGSITVASPSYPLFFIRPDLGFFFSVGVNGNGTYTYYCNGRFDYWVFCTKVDDGSQRFGLQVFNENGQLVYGSDENPLRPYTSIQLAMPQSASPGASYSGYYLDPNNGTPRQLGPLASYSSLPHNGFAFNFSDLAAAATTSFVSSGLVRSWFLAPTVRMINGGFAVDERMAMLVQGSFYGTRLFKQSPSILAVDISNI